MKVHEIMRPEAQCVGPNDSLGVAAELMRRLQVRAVPVMDHARPAGVVTEQKVEDVSAQLQRDPLLLRVREAMEECTGFVLVDDELDDALRAMQANDVDQMPVLDQSHCLVGLLVREEVPVAQH